MMNNAIIPESSRNLDEMIKSMDEAVEYFSSFLPKLPPFDFSKKKFNNFTKSC